MMPAEKVGPLAGQQPCAISAVTQRDFINRWKIWEIFHVASPVVASGTAQCIGFNEKCIGVIGSAGRRAGVNQTGRGGSVRSHRLFALPEISTPTAVLVETCAPASSFSMHHLLPPLPSAASARLLGPPVPAEGEQTNTGDTGLKLPQQSAE